MKNQNTASVGEEARKLANRITGKLRRHLVQKASAKKLYISADDALNDAIALGAPLNTPFEVRVRDRKNIVKRKIVIHDLFEKDTTVFRSKSFHRYEVADYKEPKVGTKAAKK